jgi:ATP synthase protein I
MAGQDDETPQQAEDVDDGPSDLLVVGIYGALGFEFVGAVLAGAWIGTRIDERFGTDPYGLVLSVLLMLLGVGWHIVRISRRLLKQR